MKECEKFAEEFCKTTNTEIKVEFSHTGPCIWDTAHNHDHFLVIISRGNEFMVKTYVESIFDTGCGKLPNTYDVLQSLEKYDVGKFGDFLAEMNWGITNQAEYMSAIKTYGMVKREYADVMRIFSDVIEKLREIW